MKNSRELLNKALIIVFAFALFYCSDKKEDNSLVAKAGNSVLTKSALDSALSDYKNKRKFRDEYIKEWIEKEILFQVAVDEGITEEVEYKSLIEQSKKELAAALLKAKALKDFSYSPSQTELEEYFEKFRSDFVLNDDAYRFNLIVFNSEEKAIKFRNLLLDSEWDRIANAYKSDPGVINLMNSVFRYAHEIHSEQLVFSLKVMEQNEVSVVIKSEPGYFTVVQLIEKFNRNDLPKLENIRDQVENRFLITKRMEFLRNYISEILEDNNSKIIWQTE
ncbi:MAG: peptidylprolyl isomerase [Melioribacteraceae bacterium]|nr:peptidylprolyl isomerase [Melioribacteraceae bacterium]